MKYLGTLFALLFVAISFNAQAQDDAISRYFNKYVEDERFTVVYISPKMFELFGKLNVDMDVEEAEAIKEVVKELRSLRVLVCEEEADGLFAEAKNTIDTKEYEVLMEVRNKGEENVEFLIKDSGDTIQELLLLVGTPEEFVLMSFVGNIDLDNISKLTEAFTDKEEDEDESPNND